MHSAPAGRTRSASLCLSPLLPPPPGHLSDCSRAPPAKDPAQAGAGPAAASDPCGKAVQTQQPCSVRASLSADICSGLATDGGGAHGPGDSQLAGLRACASCAGPPRSEGRGRQHTLPAASEPNP